MRRERGAAEGIGHGESLHVGVRHQLSLLVEDSSADDRTRNHGKVGLGSFSRVNVDVGGGSGRVEPALGLPEKAFFLDADGVGSGANVFKAESSVAVRSRCRRRLSGQGRKLGVQVRRSQRKSARKGRVGQ